MQNKNNEEICRNIVYAVSMTDTEKRIRALQKRMLAARRSSRPHRIVFLDFDGVVNVPYEYGTEEFDAAMAEGVYDFFRPEITVRLDRLIHDYDLRVVISSSWRYSGMEFCCNSLRNAGFSEDVVIEGMTALREDYPPRWEEILIYLEEHPNVSEFLILDDLPMRVLSPWAVQTVFEEGYSEECDRKAREILDRQIADVRKDFRLFWVAAAGLCILLILWVLSNIGGLK